MRLTHLQTRQTVYIFHPARAETLDYTEQSRAPFGSKYSVDGGLAVTLMLTSDSTAHHL